MTERTLSGPRFLPRDHRAPDSLIILLHGYGSDGDDLIALAPFWAREFPSTVFSAPNAPDRIPSWPSGRQWFPIGALDLTLMQVGANTAAPSLSAFIERETRHFGVGLDRTVVMGFSQGCMMALHVGLAMTAPLAGIMGYSGALVGTIGGIKEQISYPPVLLVHGDQDDVVPFAASQGALAMLNGRGITADLHVSTGVGHTISPDGLAAGLAFLRKVLG